MINSKPPISFFRTFRERLLTGFSWNLLSIVALQGSVLVSSIIIARLMNLQSFGLFTLVVGTVTMVTTVAQGASGSVAIKFIGEFLASDPARVSRILRICHLFTLTVGILAAAGVFFFADLIASSVLERPGFDSLVRLAAISIFFQVSVSYQIGALHGFGAFRELSYGAILVGFCHIFFISIGAWFWGTLGALAGFVLVSIIRMLVFNFFLFRVRQQHSIPNDTFLDSKDLRMVLNFALPASLAGFFTTPCLWLVTVFVARLPNGLELTGLLYVTHQVRLLILQLPLLLNSVSFSVLSRLKGQNSMFDFEHVFWTNILVNFSFSLIMVTVFIFMAEPILELYGNEFIAGRPVLLLLLISVLPEVISVSSYQLISSVGKMWHSLFLITIPRDLIYLLIAIIFLAQYGLIAAAAAYLVAHILGLIATLYIAYTFRPQ